METKKVIHGRSNGVLSPIRFAKLNPNEMNMIVKGYSFIKSQLSIYIVIITACVRTHFSYLPALSTP